MLDQNNFVVNCACVIHGDAYSWDYVDKLYAMLCRNLSYPVQLHVFTEAQRWVPPPYIKHALEPWPTISGVRRAWWYKIQMFNPEYFKGRLLYFDLDVVIVNNIDWILQSAPDKFVTIRDFRYLQKPTWDGVNSSVMCWDTTKFDDVWNVFLSQGIDNVIVKYHGDQDFLSAVVGQGRRLLLDPETIQSWRWQMFDGGQNPRTKTPKEPGTGCKIDPKVSVIVFHGQPKPHEVQDKYIQQHWRL